MLPSACKVATRKLTNNKLMLSSITCNAQKTLEFLNRSVYSGSLRTLFQNETARLDKSEFGILQL